MSKVRDKQFSTMYDAYKVELRSAIFIENGGDLALSPGDYVIHMADINCYLLASPEEFNKRFDLLVDEA